MSFKEILSEVREEYQQESKGLYLEYKEYVHKETTLSWEFCKEHMILSECGTEVVHINLCAEYQRSTGRYETIVSCTGHLTKSTDFLENLFSDPLRPTKEETMLYELEFGRPYILLDYLKNWED